MTAGRPPLAGTGGIARNVRPGGMDHDLYPFSAAPGRAPLAWPGGARVALTVLLVVESRVPDPAHAGWRPPGAPGWLDVSAASLADYGSRVGYFRLAELLAGVGARATVPVNDSVVAVARPLVAHARSEGWELVGHGPSADHPVTSASTVAAETALLTGSRDVIRAATGTAPRGWMGPAMSESWRTPAVAAEAGYDFLLDWGNDDQPYRMTAGGREIVSVPVPVDTSDLFVLGPYAQTPWDFGAALRAHLDLLLDEPAASCMTLSLHAHLSGQPYLARHVAEFLRYAAGRDGVWFARASEVVDAYRSATSV
ncbi:MAG TPA: polysaccharide deacetylase family protein [Micromonospora sp.]